MILIPERDAAVFVMPAMDVGPFVTLVNDVVARLAAADPRFASW